MISSHQPPPTAPLPLPLPSTKGPSHHVLCFPYALRPSDVSHTDFLHRPFRPFSHGPLTLPHVVVFPPSTACQQHCRHLLTSLHTKLNTPQPSSHNNINCNTDRSRTDPSPATCRRLSKDLPMYCAFPTPFRHFSHGPLTQTFQTLLARTLPLPHHVPTCRCLSNPSRRPSLQLIVSSSCLSHLCFFFRVKQYIFLSNYVKNYYISYHK